MTTSNDRDQDNLDVVFAGRDGTPHTRVPGTAPDLEQRSASELNSLTPLAGLAIPADPPAGLFDAISAEIDGLEAASIATLRADDGSWTLRREKVWKKILHDSPETGQSIYFLRCEAGATIPEHPHDRAEHAVLIEGSLIMGDLHIRAGDSQFSPAGSVHPELHSPDGCLILVHVM